MLGQTHYKVGITTYITVSCTVMLIGLQISGFDRITLAGIFAAIIGGLLADADSRESLINRNNPINKVGTSAIDFVSVALNMFFRLLFCGAFAIIPYLFKEQIVGALSSRLGAGAEHLIYLLMAVIFAVTFSSKKLFKKLSVVNQFNKTAKNILHKAVYIIMALAVCFLNLNYWNDTFIYVIGFFIAISPFFPHRTFTHTTEGWACYSLSVLYIANKFGYIHIGIAFSIGYFSHLWLTDFFTVEGINISYIVYCLGHTNVISKNSLLYKLLGRKKSLNLMSTGTDKGNRFEFVYTIVCSIIAVTLILLSRPALAFV